MKLSFLAIAFVAMAVLLLSCKPSNKNVAEVAADYCDCMQNFEKNLSEDTKRMVSKAAHAADPKVSMQEDIRALDEEKQMQIREEMLSLSKMKDDDSELGKCLRKVERKYGKAYSLENEKKVELIVKELDKKTGCSITSAIFKLGLNKNLRPGDD